MKICKSPKISKEDHKTVERFWKKVIILDVRKCWVWTGAKSEHGYGRFRFKKKAWVAPRLAWIIKNGIVPDGKLVLHRCDNPACVNPSHLFLGTQLDNMRDAIKKGRWNPNHKCKLTRSQVDKIREMYKNTNFTLQKIASLFGITAGCIYRVVSRKSWTREWGPINKGRKMKLCSTR